MSNCVLQHAAAEANQADIAVELLAKRELDTLETIWTGEVDSNVLALCTLSDRDPVQHAKVLRILKRIATHRAATPRPKASRSESEATQWANQQVDDCLKLALT